jgi:hypothetical protein
MTNGVEGLAGGIELPCSIRALEEMLASPPYRAATVRVDVDLTRRCNVRPAPVATPAWFSVDIDGAAALAGYALPPPALV